MSPGQVAALAAPGGLELRTTRLIVRTMEADDLDAMSVINADAVVSEYLLHPPWTESEHAQQWWRRVATRSVCGQAIQLIITLADGEAIGACALFEIDANQQTAVIGYQLAQAYWGLGMMREALVSTLAMGFEKIGLRRIEARVDHRNSNSVALLLRLGFQQEGILREHAWVKGALTDLVLLGLLRSKWDPLAVNASA